MKMKRAIPILLAFALVLSLLPSVRFTAAAYSDTDIAYPVAGGNIYFDKSTGTVTNCDSSVTKANIPAEIDGVAVTSIGMSAFSDCTSMVTVTIPDSVTFIGERAFYSCGSMKSLTIGNRVETISYGAFVSCTSLTSVTLPDSLRSIGTNAFFYCANLAHINIPAGVTSIGAAPFNETALYKNQDNWTAGFLYLDNWLIGVNNALSGACAVLDGTAGIAGYAFANCTLITSISIPDSVKIIADYTFYGCKSLTSVTIPTSVTSIDDYAFYGCDSLTSVTIPDSVTYLGAAAFQDCKGLTNVKISDNVTAINSLTFFGCESLTSVQIPHSVTDIAYYAFLNCTSLADVTIPDSVESIGHDVFSNTARYNNADNWTDDVLYIGNWLISAKDSIAGDYSILKNTVGVADNAFSYCTDLTNVTIPDGVRSIGFDAFYYCTNLTNVTLPDSVTRIDDYAFCNCESLASVTIPDSVTSISGGVFRYCESLTSVTIPNSVTSIDVSAFSGCTSLTGVTIPESVTSIGTHAFYNCKSLASVCFLGNAPEIGDEVFYTWDSETREYISIPGLTLYYIDGKSGWTTPTWHGYPTAIHTHTYDNSGRCSACGYAPSDAFTDIPSNAWYKSAVGYAVANGLMNGMGKGEFQPDESTTRAMVVTILYRLSGSSSKYENNFSDVLNNNWYTDAISWAAYYGIVNGMTATTFEPETSMTREMLAVILYRYTTKKTDADTTEKADLSVFPDESSVSPWAKEAMQWAVANGIVNGVGDGKTTYLQPLGNATRAQVAAIFQRYIKNVLSK